LDDESSVPSRNRDITASRPALEPNQSLILWITGVLSQRVKWSQSKAGHLLQCGVKIYEYNDWSFTSTPPKRYYRTMFKHSVKIFIHTCIHVLSSLVLLCMGVKLGLSH